MKYENKASFVPTRTIVLIGMMGAGKTSVGKRLATLLHLPFFDSDHEIEKASGMTVVDIFAIKGEAEFRQCEQKVIARILSGPLSVLSIGGGAFVDPDTRGLIKERALSLWLTADTDILLERATRHGTRPLLRVADPRAKMEALLAERSPLYAEADCTLKSDDRPVDVTVKRVLEVLEMCAQKKDNP